MRGTKCLNLMTLARAPAHPISVLISGNHALPIIFVHYIETKAILLLVTNQSQQKPTGLVAWLVFLSINPTHHSV
jgi:hypothetical protein